MKYIVSRIRQNTFVVIFCFSLALFNYVYIYRNVVTVHEIHTAGTASSRRSSIGAEATPCMQSHVVGDKEIRRIHHDEDLVHSGARKDATNMVVNSKTEFKSRSPPHIIQGRTSFKKYSPDRTSMASFDVTKWRKNCNSYNGWRTSKVKSFDERYKEETKNDTFRSYPKTSLLKENSKILEEILRSAHLTNKCKNPMSASAFFCSVQCPLEEPQLETKMKLYGMSKYSFDDLWELCRNKQVQALIWIHENVPKYLACDGNVRGKELWITKQKLISMMACSIKLPNVLYAFDNSDYSIPPGKANWLRPLPGVVRYAGTPSHPAFQFPVAEYVKATTHCRLKWHGKRNIRNDFRVCIEAWEPEPGKTLGCYPDNWAKRISSVFWRGSLTGNNIRGDTMDYNPRYNLIKTFSGKPGFNIGFLPEYNTKPASRLGQEVFDTWNKGRSKRRRPSTYCEYKTVLHIEGNSFAGSIGYKLTSGTTILWVDSHFHFDEFYYAHLKRWKHFIPVDGDLKNLNNIKDWIFETSEGKDTARNISRNARKLVQERLTPEATYCYILRLFYSLAENQKIAATENNLNASNIPVKNFKRFNF